MRVLVDTSVWSLALRKKGPTDHAAVRILSAVLMANEDVFLSGLILQEILQAFRSEASFRTIRGYLEPFPLLDMTRPDYVFAANLHRHCASKGVSVSTADCQIAAAAIRHGCRLLTTDRDFERIARQSDLDLIELG
jgi:predicted nucleic acid-binding protein